MSNEAISRKLIYSFLFEASKNCNMSLIKKRDVQ